MLLQVFYLEDAIEKTGYVVDDDSPYTLREHQLVKVNFSSRWVSYKETASTATTFLPVFASYSWLGPHAFIFTPSLWLWLMWIWPTFSSLILIKL